MDAPLDPEVRIKEAMLRSDVAATASLLDQHPEWFTPALWPIAVHQAQSLPITGLLIRRGLDPNQCSAPRLPLDLAVYRVLPNIVEALLNAGADPNRMNRLAERPIDLLENFEPRTAGDPDVARVRDLLVSHGAEVDFLLHVRVGDVRALNDLLASGTEIPAFALSTAARSARPEVAALLLRHGANPDQTNDQNNTPLWFAAQTMAKDTSARIGVMELLLEAGAEINRRCEEGTTALHYGAWRGPAAVVELLLSRGADPDIKDDFGGTALQNATARCVAADKDAILQLLAEVVH